MPNWLTKTFQAMSQAMEPEPVPYEITCSCEELFMGERTRYSQSIQCRTCGERLFLLPTNVYPEPKQRPANKKETRKIKPLSKKKKEYETKQKSTLEIAQQETKAVLPVQSESIPTETMPISRRKLLTPLRFVIVSIGLTVILTSWWLIHSYRQDQAIQTLRLSVEAGEAALKEEKLIQAEQEFAKAAKAALILKRDDNLARDVRQMHAELNAVNHLSRLSLFELVADIESKYDKEHPGILEKHFQRYYQNNWIILEAIVTRENETSYSLLLDRQKKKKEKKKKENDEREEESSPQRYVVHFPLEVQTLPLVLSVSISVLDKLPFVDSTETVLFAGQLHRCQLLNSSRPAWVIDFVPQKTLLWSSGKLLTAVGFMDDSSDEKKRIQKILDKQKQLLQHDLLPKEEE